MSKSYCELEMVAQGIGLILCLTCHIVTIQEITWPKVDNEEISAFDDSVNLALYAQKDRLIPSGVSEAIQLYLYLLEN